MVDLNNKEPIVNERWKDIEDFSAYQISDHGRVKNKITGNLLHLQKRKSGYVKVQLHENGKDYTRDVHRLVAKAFVDNPYNKPDVNHDNGRKDDNVYTNLTWMTKQENIQHAMRTGLFTPKAPEPLRTPVRIVETGEIFDSITACANEIGSSVINIVNALREDVHDHHSCKGLHFEYVSSEDYQKYLNSKQEIDLGSRKKSQPFLYPFQMEAVKKAFSGCIFNGGTGSGKSRTSLFWYFKEQGGWIDENGYIPMKNPKDLYIITVASKRDKLEWEEELGPFRMTTHPEASYYKHKVVVDSWNSIKKYENVVGAVFLFDEDKITGKGAWSKSFLKIAKNNDWAVLSASPGDCWEDFETIFIANGFYKNRTEFSREHLVYSRFSKYPKVERYINTSRLMRLRNKILIDMAFERHTTQHHEDVYCSYDIPLYKQVIKTRFDPFKNEPLQQASQLCYLLRKIVNSDESRQVKLLELLEDHPRAIIFYSYDYEREILHNLYYGSDVKIAEWTGWKHEPIPDSDKWVYLVNYASGAEGFNCTSTNTIIFYSQTYSYKTLLQAIGRIDRINTKFIDLYYYHLKSRSGIDLAISKALKNKKKFNEQRWLDGH